MKSQKPETTITRMGSTSVYARAGPYSQTADVVQDLNTNFGDRTPEQSTFQLKVRLDFTFFPYCDTGRSFSKSGRRITFQPYWYERRHDLPTVIKLLQIHRGVPYHRMF
jgi:hypothetical protein